MPTLVEIDGAMVDMDDPCAVVTALRMVELKVATAGAVIMTKFSADNEVRWSQGNLAQLGDLIARYERSCDRRTGKRTRYAKRMRFTC